MNEIEQLYKQYKQMKKSAEGEMLAFVVRFDTVFESLYNELLEHFTVEKADEAKRKLKSMIRIMK